MPGMNVERLTDAVAYHAEGPVWSERWGGLRWVDIFAGDISLGGLPILEFAG